MKYSVISGDSHIDMGYLPADLFVSRAPAQWKDRMPRVVETEEGLRWKCGDSDLGGAGAPQARVRVRTGWSKRMDQMLETSFFSDAEQGRYHPTTLDLRLKDQDIDGIQAEVIYGILGLGAEIKDREVARQVFHCYNQWVADFVKQNPQRLAALACIPNHDPEVAAAELRQAAELGLKGADFAVTTAVKPIYHRDWDVLWATAAEHNMPISFHCLGITPRKPDPEDAQKYDLQYRATSTSMFQLAGAEYLGSIIFSGSCERYPNFKFVLGECGVSWLPYVVDRMDHEYEDRYYHLNLGMMPSEFWRRQGYSTYQKERVSGDIIPLIGVDNVIWGSDYPHQDGVWPDSQQVIRDNLGNLEEGAKRKVICENAGKLYGFIK